MVLSSALGAIVAAVYGALAAVHLVWAAGGATGGSAIPTIDGRPTFTPGRATTLAVALALAAAAVTVMLRVGLLDSPIPPAVVRVGTGLLGLAFVLRAIGDFRLVGFFKTVRNSRFAINDTRFFSPLCLGLGSAVLWLAAVPSGSPASQAGAPRGYSIVARYPHDPAAYTQGLVHRPGGVLLESTGLYGQSDVRRVTLKTGVVGEVTPLPTDRFGEGLALHGGSLYQLTWQSGIAYIYDPGTLKRRDSVAYTGEGWGLTSDGTSLIMSDGSDTLRFRDPATFKVRRAIAVRFKTREPVGKLNELEYVGGEIFANVYQSDWVLRIDAESGEVRGILDFGGLLPGFGSAETSENVLNGIAVDESSGHLFITGKRWPTLFEIKLDARRP